MISPGGTVSNEVRSCVISHSFSIVLSYPTLCLSFQLNLPMNNVVPRSELTKEPFRWDQRVFGIVLRMPAVPPVENAGTYIPPADDAAIDAMCDVTGGRSYKVVSQRMLNSCVESLVQKCQSGVVINFEKIGADPTPLDGAF